MSFTSPAMLSTLYFDHLTKPEACQFKGSGKVYGTTLVKFKVGPLTIEYIHSCDGTSFSM